MANESDDIGSPYIRVRQGQHYETGRPMPLVVPVEATDEMKTKSYSYEDVQDAACVGAIAGWAKAMDVMSNMLQLCRGDAVALMENAGMEVTSDQGAPPEDDTTS